MNDPHNDYSPPQRKRRDRRRTFGQLLQRARRGEDVKLRADDRAKETNMARVFAQLEHLKEGPNAGETLDQDDFDFLMAVVDELVVLPVRHGAKPLRGDFAAERKKELAEGRKRIRKLKKDGRSAEAAMSIVVSDLKKLPAFAAWKKTSTFEDRLRRNSD